MKRYTVTSTDCECDVWFDSVENKVLDYKQIEQILEKQDTKWQKLKEYIQKDREFNLQHGKIGSATCQMFILEKMQELESE